MSEEELVKSYLTLKEFLLHQAGVVSNDHFESLKSDLALLENEIRKNRFSDFVVLKNEMLSRCLSLIIQKIQKIPGEHVEFEQGIIPRVGLALKIGRDMETILTSSSGLFQISEYFAGTPGITKKEFIQLLEKEVGILELNPPENFVELYQLKENFIIYLSVVFNDLLGEKGI